MLMTDDLSSTCPELQALQSDRLVHLMRTIVPGNPFYAAKLSRAGIELESIGGVQDLPRLPFTTKAELLADQQKHPPYGSNLSAPRNRYCRLHQTSGTTTGQPLRWLDTADSWQALLNCWRKGFALIRLQAGDRLFFPFSFGPFLGFWTAFEAAVQAGYFCLAGGGLTSAARLRMIHDHQVTVVLTTPTYALHLADVAHSEGIPLAGGPVRALVLAGEPGGSIAETRHRLESAWQARVYDHYGLTEVGPVAFESDDEPHLMTILETDYIAEVIDPQSLQPIPPGETGELVLTTLSRTDSPLIRYRTGDIVRLDSACGSAQVGLKLKGILGRVDDMIQIRGNNVYPSALEAIIRRFPQILEYRVTVEHNESLANLCIEVEIPTGGDAQEIVSRLTRSIQNELLFRVDVRAVPAGTLPRFEMKSRRIVRVR